MIITFLTQASIDSSAAAKITANADKFEQIDPWGIGITAIGIGVVFISLLLLYALFYNITKILNLKLRRERRKEGKEISPELKSQEIPGEVNAAIAMALHIFFSEQHDRENTVLTINRVARTYSPWSSKIYGLRQYPR